MGTSAAQSHKTLDKAFSNDELTCLNLKLHLKLRCSKSNFYMQPAIIEAIIDAGLNFEEPLILTQFSINTFSHLFKV